MDSEFPVIALVDVDRHVVEAWQKVWADTTDEVLIRHGSIFELDLPVSAIVSPGNSFGFMDGGIDRAISERLGWNVQERLQERIRKRHHGELVVGNAEYVEPDWEGEAIHLVIAAPTMRVPQVLGAETVNPYLATRAALLLVKYGKMDKGTPIRDFWMEVVAFPGMGTGVGQVPPEICARQMRRAFDEVVLEKPTFPASWLDAQTQHQLLYRDQTWDLQQEKPVR